ncbi:MAG: ribosomal adenine dimethylase [Firmicutes bacterium]|nr:ribosomal adenine dimethylase [Bacillota bacterium]
MIMNDEKWLYNEMSHSGVDFSDSREVQIYDSYMQKIRNIEPEVAKMKDALILGSDDSVLDIGTGTGEMAIGLACHCKQVLAIDVSAAMIEYAEQKAERRGCSNITFQQAGFLTFAQPQQSLDRVISQFALHHLPDFWKFIALKRIYTALKPGGIFCLQDAVLPVKVDDYKRYFTDVVKQIEISGGEKVARDTEKTIRDEYVTLDWIMEGLLEKAGFTITSQEYGAPFIGTYLCTK